MRKPKLAKNLPPPVELSQEEIEKIIEEGRKAAKSIYEPKKLGDYIVEHNGYGEIRGEKLEKTCSACHNQLENLYHLVNTEPGLIGARGTCIWAIKCTRCSQCGLKYDLTGL